MADITLRAEAGRPVGSPDARRLRRSGRVPAIVYGRGVAPMAVSIEGRDLRVALSTEAGLNALLALEVGGSEYLTMAREIQRHPARGTVLHLDLQVVGREQVVSADVPVTLVGEALEVAHVDGVVDQELFNISIKAKPADIPPAIEVDISGLVVGGTIRIADVVLPPGASSDLDPETVLVHGVPPRVMTRAEEAAGAAPEGGVEAGASSAEASGSEP